MGNCEDESLISILETPALRVELALLVLLNIDAVRKEITASFDERLLSTAQDYKTSPAPITKNLLDLDGPPNPLDTATTPPDSTPTDLIDLRRSSLTYCDRWRSSIMQRVCDVLSVRGESVRQAKKRRQQARQSAQEMTRGTSSLIDFGDTDPFASSDNSHARKVGFYEVVESRILDLDREKRVTILNCLFLIFLSLENYTAHSRILLLRLASSLELESGTLAAQEAQIAQTLLATATSQMDAEQTTKRQATNNAASRKWKVGLAAVGGAVLIGVTGGLAAPLLAAGLGTIMSGIGLGAISTYLGALAGSSVLVGSLFGAYGAKMTGRIMEKYAKEIDDFEFFPVGKDKPRIQLVDEWSDEQNAQAIILNREDHRLRVAIGISGWLNTASDVNKPWEILNRSSTEPFALRFELDAMLKLGESLEGVVLNYAWNGLTFAVARQTILGALYAGLWPLSLIQAASVLENPFSVALARADKAGKVLAHALIDGVQGKRPVTLIGYSIGARVVFSCLLELARQHKFGLVESAALLGTPATSSRRSWCQVASVVSGRMVNVYSPDDFVLGFLYRSSKLQRGVAGLQGVVDVNRVENFNAAKFVTGHDQYRYAVGSILEEISFDDVDSIKVEEQKNEFETVEFRKKQMKLKAEADVTVSSPKITTSLPNCPELRESAKITSNNLLLSDLAPVGFPQVPATLDEEDVAVPGCSTKDDTHSAYPNNGRQDRQDTLAKMLAIDSASTVGTEKIKEKTIVSELSVMDSDKEDATSSSSKGDRIHLEAFDDESGSDMDELMMVEPLPMDDNDWGLI